jgi:hypothetical protein
MGPASYHRQPGIQCLPQFVTAIQSITIAAADAKGGVMKLTGEKATLTDKVSFVLFTF